MQHKTKLFLVNVATLSKDMYYTQVLQRLGRHRKLRLEAPLAVGPLLAMAPATRGRMLRRRRRRSRPTARW